MKTNALALFCREIILFLQPLADLADASDDDILDFFEGLGYNLRKALQTGEKKKIVDEIAKVVKAVVIILKELKTIRPVLKDTIDKIDFPNDIKELKILVKEFPEDITGLLDWYKLIEPSITIITEAQDGIIKYCKDIISASTDPKIKAALGQLPVVTLNALTYYYLKRRHPVLLPAMEFLTLAEWEEREELKVGNEVWITKNVVPKFHLKVLGDLFTKPGEVMKQEYWPGGFTNINLVNEAALNFFGRIDAILRALGANTVLGLPGLESNPSLTTDEQLRVKGLFTWSFPFYKANADNLNEIGASMGLLVEKGSGYWGADNGPGVFVYPFINISFEEKTRRWHFSLSGNLNPGGVKINKDGINWLVTNTPNDAVQFDIKPAPGQETLYTIGGETRLEIGSPRLNAAYKLDNNQPDLGAVLTFDGNKIVLATSKNDGFLGKILPKDGIEVPFNLGLGWSNRKGFYFTGSAGLEITLSINQTLFKALRFNWVKLSLRADESALLTSARISFGLKLKAFNATVSGMGLQYRWTYPKNGSLGTSKAEFLPPTAIGLRISTGGLTGGGYLSVENGRYAGILELTFQSKVSFKAIAIVDTKVQLPNGEKGFALILLVFVEGFKEIPLSMGFSLAGIGGLLALHRGMDIDALRMGVQDKSFDSILFPKDPVANAETIIRDIDKAFPLRQNSFVIGPTAIITWGTAKALIKVKLGLFFELEEGKFTTIAVPGILTCILPKEDAKKPPVALRVNFLGLLSFDLGEFSFEASIFDSKIGTFALSGDMLVRLIWKGTPNFVLSAGGFNPRYTPPQGVRQLRRLQLVLINDEDAKLQLQAYMAITSNSVQLGARLDAYFKKGDFEVVGYLGFDLLFQFNPFRFSLSIYASLSVQRKGEVLLAISLEMYLEGPAPWYFVGKASFKVLGIEVSINVEKRIGEDAETDVNLPDINLKDWVKNELVKPENWQAIDAAKSSLSLFTLKAPDGSTSNALLPPQAQLRITQDQVPLFEHIEKVGTAKPTVVGSVEIIRVRCDNVDLLLNKSDVLNAFAPAQFKNMSDEDKVSSPAFVQYVSGVLADAPGGVQSGKAIKVPEQVESFVIQNGKKGFAPRPGSDWTKLELDALLRKGPAGSSPFSPLNSNTLPRSADAGNRPILRARKKTIV